MKKIKQFTDNCIEKCEYFLPVDLETNSSGVITIDKCTHLDTYGRYKPCNPETNEWCCYKKVQKD